MMSVQPRPELVYMAPWDIPEPPEPVDLGRLLEAMVAAFVPNVNTSWEQARRWGHVDLPEMSDKQLWQERRRCEYLLVWLPENDPRLEWVEQRLGMVMVEQTRRCQR